MYSFAGGATLRRSARPSNDDTTACPDIANATDGELLAWVEQTWRDPSFAAAVELASPALAAQVLALLATPHPCTRTVRRIAMSSLRYRLRCTSRATPFGLFAGIAVLQVDDSAAAASIGGAHRAVARVDHRWITKVVDEAMQSRDFARGMPVVVDGRAIVRDGRLVLADAASSSASGAGAREVSVRLTAPVAATLRRALEPVARCELIDGLAAEFPAATPRAVDGMVTALLSQGFLVGALHPPMTVTDPLAHVAHTASRVDLDGDQDEAGVVRELRRINELLRRHDTATTAEDQRALRAAAIPRMRALDDTVVTPLGVDLVLDADVVIPHAVAVEAAEAASVLVRLATEPNGPAGWRDYHRRFLDRYGVGAVVGLPDLLHTGTGLGYPAGFRGTHLPAATAPRNAHARRRAELLARLTHTAAWDRSREAELTDADLDALTAGVDIAPQPHTDLRIEVHAQTRAALDAGHFDLFVVGASRAAGTVTGRFVDILDPDGTGPVTTTLRGLPTATRHATRVQLSGPPATPDAATITRSAPVLDRQLVVGGYAPAGSVLPADLAVSADPAGLYLVLTATGEPIEPTAFTALELVRCADPTLRFLAEIATSACAPCSPFMWDAALRELPFLPRVRYRRAVLSPARWTVRAADLPCDAPSAAWRAWRDRWAVPDKVLLGQHDQRLGLDLTEPAHRQILADTLRRAGRVTLLEAPAPGAFGWIDDHPHELVLPFATTVAARHPRRPRPTAKSSRPRHTPAASRWLSAHLACRPEQQTAVLTEHLTQLLADLDNAGIAEISVADTGVADSAWYIRLTEPDHHLRLRIPLRHAHYFGKAAEHVAVWADRLTTSGLTGALEFRTYLPETGRYGCGPAQRAAEAVFAADSAAALAQLTVTTPTNSPAVEALTAASMVDLVAAFSDTLQDGWAWLIRHAPRTVAFPPRRDLRARTIDLAHPDRRHVAELFGGGHVVEAWDRRRIALTGYRQSLLAQDIDPRTVLPDLLHLHHARTAGPHLDREAACLHLARSAALSHRARAAQPESAA